MGRGRAHSNGDQVLRMHIEAAGKDYSTVEELVDHLRSSYPQYSRLKVRPFTKHVERVMMASSRRSEVTNDSNDDGDSPTVKKRRKMDGKEEKMHVIETEHVRRGRYASNTGSSSSLASACSSDDAVYDEPEYDLMKSMMREDLLRKSNQAGEESASEEAVELEMVDSKGAKEPKKLNRVMFKDLGGMSRVIERLKKDMREHLYNNPRIAHEIGVNPVTVAGILLHGPPGCGKTMLAHAIANETGLPFYDISAAELVSGVSGASEENIRELFSKAYRTAPSIVFIDEIDAIASNRENSQRGMEQRIVTQLMTCMSDGSISSVPILVIGATNRPDVLDPALRRPGRFDREYMLGLPDEDARVEILSALTSRLKVVGALDLLKLARATPGFVGSDLAGLVKEAVNLATNRPIINRKDREDWWKQRLSDEDMKHLYITMADFEEAVKLVQPSLKRKGFSTIPNVKWDDVGGLHSLRQHLELSFINQIKFPDKFKHFGMALNAGVLLFGPPGCGKTLIAKAFANESGANFIHIKGPELLDKYVGESEKAMRTLFSRARACSPCVVFFDEVDALTNERGKGGGGVVGRSILTQLLLELDGAHDRSGVYVFGATNRPQDVDPALLRPRRFEKRMYVTLPSPDERGSILKALAKEKPIDSSVDLIALGKDSRCHKLSGADLFALMNEAARNACYDSCNVELTIKDEHFTSALKEISPSVSDEQMRHYERLKERFNAKYGK